MEPNNDMMKEYEVVLQERIAQLASGEGVDDDEDDSSSDEADEETDDESSESEEEEES